MSGSQIKMLGSLFLHYAISQYLFSHRLLRPFNLGLQLLLSEQIFPFIFQGLFFLIIRLGYQLGFLIYSFIFLSAFLNSPFKCVPLRKACGRVAVMKCKYFFCLPAKVNGFFIFIFLPIFSFCFWVLVMIMINFFSF